jgi:hypothetical protein
MKDVIQMLSDVIQFWTPPYDGIYDASRAGRNLTDERARMATKKSSKKLKKGKKLAATKPLTQSFLKIKSANTSFLKTS